MHKLAIAAALGAALMFPRLSRAAEPIPLPWKVGTTLHYQSTTVATRAGRGGKRVTTLQGSTTVAITAADGQGFVQSWRDGPFSVEVVGDGAGIDDERKMASQVQKRFEGVAVEAELDSRGLYKGVRNWQPLAAAMRDTMLPIMMAGARRQAGAAALSDAELQSKLQPLLDKVTSQSAIDAAFGENPSIYNLFSAPALEPGKPVRYEDALSSPVSDDKIPAIGLFEIIGEDQAAGTVTIHWMQMIDPIKGMAAAWKMVQAVTGQAAPAAPAGLPKELVLHDEANVTLNRGSGVITQLEYRRNMQLGELTRSTQWTLQLQK